MTNKQKNIVILGGGFAGVKCALELVRLGCSDLITLISNRDNFEYHGALYRLATGSPKDEVCISLREIFKNTNVKIQNETVESIDKDSQKIICTSGEQISYDSLVIGLGAETTFFGIQGLQKYSYGIKTIDDALHLKNHLESVCEDASEKDNAAKQKAVTVVVVGAGPTGVEIAAELSFYLQDIVQKYEIDPSMITIELVEAQDRILPMFDKSFTDTIEQRLRSLGVNVLKSRPIQKAKSDEVHLQDMKVKTSTIIWTAGVAACHLIKEAGLQTDRMGRAIVNSKLQVKGHTNIYAAGDAASTKKSGMAQIALYDAKYIANMIVSRNKYKVMYKPDTPIYAIPVGRNWAGTSIGSLEFYGSVGWALRKLVDLAVYVSLLPMFDALTLFAKHMMPAHASKKLAT